MCWNDQNASRRHHSHRSQTRRNGHWHSLQAYGWMHYPLFPPACWCDNRIDSRSPDWYPQSHRHPKCRTRSCHDPEHRRSRCKCATGGLILPPQVCPQSGYPADRNANHHAPPKRPRRANGTQRCAPSDRAMAANCRMPVRSVYPPHQASSAQNHLRPYLRSRI